MGETPVESESSRCPMAQTVEIVDLSTAMRIKGVLNWIRNLGFVLASFLIFFCAADGRFIIVVVIAFAAHILLARGSRTAAAVLVLLALALGWYFERSYREAMALYRDRPAIEAAGPLQAAADSGVRKLIAFHRTLAWCCLGLAAVYLGALILTVSYRRRVPAPPRDLDWRRRLALRIALFRVRLTPKAVLYGSLALLCGLVVMAPGLVLILSLLFHIPRTGLTGPVLDWAFDIYGWWWVVVTFVFVIACLRLWPRAKRHAALVADRAKAVDTRQPILLLRSFADDTTPLVRSGDQHSWMRSIVSPTIWTLEETIEEILREHGPLIAIGRPGESVPPAGAAREYLNGDNWKERVEELIGEVRFVVIILGETEGLKFEYEALLRLGLLQRMTLVVPPRKPAEIAVRWRRFCEALGGGDPIAAADLSRALAVCFSPEGIMTLVTCYRRDDEDCYRLALNRSLVEIRKQG